MAAVTIDPKRSGYKNYDDDGDDDDDDDNRGRGMLPPIQACGRERQNQRQERKVTVVRSDVVKTDDFEIIELR
jgi:hypothetical protein